MNRLKPTPHLMHSLLSSRMEGEITNIAPDGSSAWVRFDGLEVLADQKGVRISLTLNGKRIAEYTYAEWVNFDDRRCKSVTFVLDDVTGKARIEFKE